MKQLVLAIGPLVIGFAGTGVLPVLAIETTERVTLSWRSWHDW